MLSIPDKAKVNAKHYGETLLPRFFEECKSVHMELFTDAAVKLPTLCSFRLQLNVELFNRVYH